MEREWDIYYIEPTGILRKTVTALDIQDAIYTASSVGVGSYQIVAIKQAFFDKAVSS